MLIWDNHGCMPLNVGLPFMEQLERYRQGGATVVSLNVGYANYPLQEHLRLLSAMRRWLRRHSSRFSLISTVADIEQCYDNGRLGIVFDVEGMCPVEKDISMVQTFYELGVRWMLIAYNRNNKAGGGCLDIDCGLTDLGRQVIDEMERVGMALCLSHAGYKTVEDALAYCRKPPIFSHSNPYRCTPHPRNVPDELLIACAKKGGVIGLSGYGPFLGAGKDPYQNLLRDIRYLCDLVGPDHVALGLDYVFDKSELAASVNADPSLFPSGVGAEATMIEPESLSRLVSDLLQELSAEHVACIMGQNWKRIAASVWQ